MRDEEVETADTNNCLEKCCLLSRGVITKCEAKEMGTFRGRDGRKLEMERNQLGLGYDMKEEQDGLYCFLGVKCYLWLTTDTIPYALLIATCCVIGTLVNKKK